MESQEFKTDFEKLKFLLNLVREANLYHRKVMVIQKLQEVAAYAHFFEYDFDHWQETGMWRKYSDFLLKTDKTETVETETEIKTETRQTIAKHCDFCSEEFFTNKSAQRFCADKAKNCKNNYHNANK